MIKLEPGLTLNALRNCFFHIDPYVLNFEPGVGDKNFRNPFY